MRHPDITIWTAGPPTAVSNCTVQVRGGPGGIATYFYRVIAHYPIGSVISPVFTVRGAPKPTDAQHYVVISWEAPGPGALSYDVLRTPEESLPPDGTPCGLALGVTSTRILDQGQTPTPYSLSGLPHGSTTDGWAHMNNRDYNRPVLELWPTVRITSILFADGSEQQSAGGGVIAGVSSVFGRAGHVTAQAGDYNATQIPLQPPIGTWTNVQNALDSISQSISTAGFWQAGTAGAIYYSGGNVGIKQANPQFSLDIVGSINVTGGFFLNGTLFAGTGIPLMAGATSGLAHIGTTPPASPEPGQFWFDSSTLKLLIRYGHDWLELTAPAKARRIPQ